MRVTRYIPIRVSKSACVEAHVKRHTYISPYAEVIVYYFTYHDRVIDAPMSESKPDVVNPHPQLSQSQTHHLKRYQLLATREKERRVREREEEKKRRRGRKRGRVKQLTLEQLEKVVQVRPSLLARQVHLVA